MPLSKNLDEYAIQIEEKLQEILTKNDTYTMQYEEKENDMSGRGKILLEINNGNKYKGKILPSGSNLKLISEVGEKEEITYEMNADQIAIIVDSIENIIQKYN